LSHRWPRCSSLLASAWGYSLAYTLEKPGSGICWLLCLGCFFDRSWFWRFCQWRHLLSVIHALATAQFAFLAGGPIVGKPPVRGHSILCFLANQIRCLTGC
jgi:hypothetical protein